ncbi:MAG: site-2 protease family protein [Rhodospirillaceae bacterium]|nr:site-2 protease family protein [Rhodospirillaceae bacterium]
MMDGLDFNAILVTASVWILPILLAVTMHEAAHGWVAWKLGDDTAKRAGRVTFNPISHIDLFGTIIVPAMLLLASGGKYMFGFAKPVPVNFFALKRPRRDMILVAAAGPGANIIIATICAILLNWAHMLPEIAVDWVASNLLISLHINVILAVFNLLPLPPLDGGRIAVGILPQPFSGALSRLEKAGFLIIIFALFILPWIGDKIGADLNIIWWLVGVPAGYLTNAIAGLAGLT